ncbi:MAG: ATP-binding protein [Sphaerochaetaceae bacterium]|nr:ATP-binding protein [Sphaerochaetaceae bacterium]
MNKKTLTPDGYIPRLIDKQIDDMMRIYGAVCIEGPKWCGKTWTSSNHAVSMKSLGNPERNFQNKRLAEMDPDLIFDGEKPLLIDEWQEVPQLWDAVKFKVDQLQSKGQFILTGSSSPRRRGILHSGSGRIGNVRMRTMSLFEMGKSSGVVSLKDLFNNSVKSQNVGEISLESIIDMILHGGWPGSISMTAEESQKIARDYLLNVPDDMKKLDGKTRNAGKVYSLLRSLGRNESTMTSKTKILNDMDEYEEDKINIPEKDSVTDYLDCFLKLFLIEDQPVFSEKLRSSVKALKKPKRHFTDPSLAAAAIGATREMLLNDLNTLGFLFESLCIHDLRIYAEANDGSVYHYHDERNKEADAIIQFSNGQWGMFEVKLGFNQVDSAAESLLALQSSFLSETSTKPDFLCVVCGMSNAAYKRPDGVYVVPITALRD